VIAGIEVIVKELKKELGKEELASALSNEYIGRLRRIHHLS
jgi:hypothetical protein